MAYVKRRSNRTFINLDKELKERVKLLAEKENKPMSTLLYEIVRDHIDNNTIFDFIELKGENEAYIVFRGSTILVVGRGKDNPIVKKRINEYVKKNKNTYKLFNVIYSDISDVINIEV